MGRTGGAVAAAGGAQGACKADDNKTFRRWVLGLLSYGCYWAYLWALGLAPYGCYGAHWGRSGSCLVAQDTKVYNYSAPLWVLW